MLSSVNGTSFRKSSRLEVKSLMLYTELLAAEFHVEHGYYEMPSLPVDVTVIAKGAGAKVFWGELGDEPHDGFIYMPRDGVPEITVDSHLSPTRKRFVTAHELGFLLHARQTGNGAEAGHVDSESTLGEEALTRDIRQDVVVALHPSVEDFSNMFAAALLMPRPLTTTLLKAKASTEEIAAVFNVSETVAAYRIRNLRSIMELPLPTV